MPRNEKTDWLTVGRSGPTVDGRTIQPKMILDVAETYNLTLFAALIWPEHFRHANFGQVERVRAVKNGEGGYDLQAILAPNDFYRNSNAYGQKLYTSMEITENFRKTGKFYLTGLGATDSPASAATSEVRFSQEGTGSYRATSQAITIIPKPSLLGGWFGTDEDDMNKELLQALVDELKGLRTEFTALKAQVEKPAAPPPADPIADQFAALEQKVDELVAKFSAPPPTTPPVEADKFKAVEDKLTALEQQFAEALKAPHPGTTQPPAQTGADGDRKDYL